jgi:hypothetical protein
MNLLSTGLKQHLIKLASNPENNTGFDPPIGYLIGNGEPLTMFSISGKYVAKIIFQVLTLIV